MTFDDGPHPQNTPRLLDMLRARNIKATFFGHSCRNVPTYLETLYAGRLPKGMKSGCTHGITVC